MDLAKIMDNNCSMSICFKTYLEYYGSGNHNLKAQLSRVSLKKSSKDDEDTKIQLIKGIFEGSG